MEFDISHYCSAGLRQVLHVKGLVDKPSFELPIKKHPFFEYMDYLKQKRGIAFVREFHIGCSSDQRPPNIRYTAKKEGYAGELFFYAEQWINDDVCWKKGYFHDKNGLRDLDAVSAAFNDKAKTNERVRVGWTGPGSVLTGSDRCCYRSGSFEIILEDGKWEDVSGLDVFCDRTLGTGATEKAILGRIIEGTDSPFNRKGMQAIARKHQSLSAERFSKRLALPDAIGEAVKIMWPDLRNETAEEKAARDAFFKGIPIAEE